MPIRFRRAALFLALGLGLGLPEGRAFAQQGTRPTGPWDMEALKVPPAATWGAAKGRVREVTYEGAKLGGRATRVFGYYGRPSTGSGPFPAVVLIHGGGGKAYEQWARMWVDRGYVSLAMDLGGRGADRKRLLDGIPEQDDDTKFRDFDPADPSGMWTYQAVAAIVRGISFLASREEVDPNRIGVHGISWGGYLTCIVAGIDDRIKVAVPVYGCGFIHEDSFWKPARFDAVSPDRRDRWADAFDPSKYLPGVTCPILYINGTNDFAYPLDSAQRSYRSVARFEDLAGPGRLRVTLRMPHGHEAGWAPREIALFVDHALKGGDPLPKLTLPEVVGPKITSKFASRAPIDRARILYAVDAGPWPQRQWKETAAVVVGTTIEAPLPAPRPLVVFLNIVDRRGALVSSPHLVVPAGK